VFAAPLPEVLRETVMDRIGASTTWQWHGYEDAHAGVDGRRLESVSGGAHWGGGLWASAYDHARVGLLYLRGGRWHNDRVIRPAWVAQSWEPCEARPDYGMLWWRNDLGTVFPQAPTTGRCARGNLGRQLVWIDPTRDLVVVSRWSDRVDHFLAQLSSAIPAQTNSTLG
jgi:CubicO group peptidase (beta-lactamase class C family)